MTVVRWILGWSVGLAVPAAVFVFVAGPEEAARVARDAWSGVRGATSETWSGLSSAEQPVEKWEVEEGGYGWLEGRTSYFGLICERDKGTASVVDEGVFLSELRDRVKTKIVSSPQVRLIELEMDAPPPSTLPLGREVSTEVRWTESRRGQVRVKEGMARFRLNYPCNYFYVGELEVITEGVVPPPVPGG